MSADERSRVRWDSLNETKARVGAARAGAYDTVARYLESVRYSSVKEEKESADQRHTTRHEEAAMLTHEITMRELTAQPTAVVRTELPAEDLGGWLVVAYHAVADHLQRQGLRPAGRPFARFAFLDGTVAAEAGFPVDQEIAGGDDVEPSVLPAGPAAVTTHRGRYEELDAAYRAVRDWAAGHGYEPAGPQWEVYYTDPNAERDTKRWRTDVVLPLRRAAAGG